jgi:ABC-2 type transport system permease protein
MRGLGLATAPPPITEVTPPGIAKPIDDLSGFQVTVPGNAVLFGFFIAMAVAISFASERHTGTWRRLLASPVPRWQALFGKLVPYYLISLVQLAFLFGIGAGLFGMKIAGSVGALIVVCMAVSLCAVSFGMLVASFGGTEKQIGSIVPVVLLVMGLIGGCMFPRILMPPAMQQIGHAVPHSWALDAYTDLLVRTGTGLAQVATPIVAIVGFAVLFAGAGLLRFRFER